ncbi:MAG TPA: GNAT family N-acetyltransferase [Rhodoblastus sp.]|nr:GNAT family N-acetyltransferase [Rhodoblastus sp.]
MIEIRKAATGQDFAFCIQIRTLVFVVGQNVPRDRDIDRFEPDALNYLALSNGAPVGTARWRRETGAAAKIERLAVLEQARGAGIGAGLMRFILAELAATPGLDQAVISAQDHAIPFYQGLGFDVVGEGYEDSGIPHHKMVKNLGAPAPQGAGLPRI